MKTITIALALMICIANAESASAEPVKTIRLSPIEAVRRALRKNLGLKYERLAPELSRANERKARAVTGVFFGLYPARKASRLDPIDALRHE